MQRVCLSVFVVSLVALSGCNATKQSYLAKGDKFFAAGKYPDAALNYRSAIQKDAAYGEAYYRLGLTAIRLEHATEAYDALYRAVRLSPANSEAKIQFANVCLSLYLADRNHSQVLYSQIGTLADEFLAQNANSYEGLMLKGYLASTDRKPQEAIEYFRRALRAGPADAGVVTELAHLLIQNDETQEGEQLATDLIVHNRTSYGPAYDLMYNFYLKAGRPQEAEATLKLKADNNPKNADYILQLARYYNREQNAAGMTGALNRLLDDPKDFPQARLSIGDFYLGLRDYPEAISYYQQGANSSRDAKAKVAYQTRAVLALLKAGKKDDAVQLAEQLRQEHPNDNAVLRVHADLLLDRGQREQADLIIREFQTLLNLNPSDTPLRMQLGRAYRLKGDLEGARSQFLDVIHRGQDVLAARYEMADVSLALHRPQEAVQQANEILSTQPNDRRARLLYARGLIGTGDAEAARGALSRLSQDFPQDAEPQLQMGLLALSQKNFAHAIDILSKQRASGDARTFAALATAYLNERQFDQARAILTEGLGRWPGSSILMEQLGDTEALLGNYGVALAQYQKLLSVEPRSAILRRRMAEVLDIAGDHARALATYQQAHDLAPNDAATAENLADALARAGRLDQARQLYQAVAKAHPENAPALNNVAFFLADSGGDLDEALRLAKNALAVSPGQPSFSDTIGYIYLKKGMLDSAIQSFSTLAHRYPASASFRYHLGLALFQKGERAVARKELQAALANHPSAQETLRIRELLNAIS